jgi:hypothetical protein
LRGMARLKQNEGLGKKAERLQVSAKVIECT